MIPDYVKRVGARDPDLTHASQGYIFFVDPMIQITDFLKTISQRPFLFYAAIMPFFILHIENVCDKIRALKFTLAQSPNGTPLSNAQAIWTPNLSQNVRVYWMDDDHVTASRIEEIQSLGGVKAFDELEEITVTIYDASWRYESNYIDQIFLPVVETYL